jgi:APA family basic amino acid/polyamine antiporter
LNSRRELIRGLTLTGAIAINVGDMIGTGVFLKARAMTCNVGSARSVLLVWVLAGVLSLLGSFAYAELAAMMPEAGGSYLYLRRAFGRVWGFLYGWTFVLLGTAGAQAALAIGFAIFINVLAGGALSRWQLPLFPHASIVVSGLTLLALAVLWLVALINCLSVSESSRIAVVLFWIKVLILLLVGVAGFTLAQGSFTHLAESATGGGCSDIAASARGGIVGFGAAMLGALWAYDGWNNVAPMIGELKDPKRNVPRAFLMGTLLVIALYLFVNLAYFYVLTPAQIAAISTSSSVATEVMRQYLGPLALGCTAIALAVCSFGALYASTLANGRVPFAMARGGLFFRALGTLSARSQVPVRSILAQSSFASLLAVSGTYDTLTDALIFAEWLFYGLTVAALLRLRRTEPAAERPYRAPLQPLLSLIFIALTVALIVNTFIATPRQAFTGMIIVLVGLPFYLYWSRRTPTAYAPAVEPANRS